MTGLKRRKKQYQALGLAAVLSFSASFAAFGGWVSQEDGLYYYYEDGSPADGWVEEDGKFYYFEDGKALADCITPDGYYVDYSGMWYRRYNTIIGATFAAPSQVVAPSSGWVGKDCLRDIKTNIGQVFSDNRNLKISESALEYVQLEYVEDSKSGTSTTGSSITGIGDIIIRTTGTSSSGASTGNSSSSQSSTEKDSSKKTTKEILLLGLYREPSQGRYRLDVKIALDGDRDDVSQSSYYDYGVFLAMAYQISSSPELLADGLYSAWEEDNRWGISRQRWVRIGDCMVLYTSGDGFGRFYISPAQGGM